MGERPILFSGEMVRAILDGRKTQTRRVCGPDIQQLTGGFGNFRCPYGVPGDRLWCRESFQPLLAHGVKWSDSNWETGEGYAISYPATDGIKEYFDCANDEAFCNRVKPSIFMPRWASRINLEVTKVRVERVQEISGQDIGAEGIDLAGNYRAHFRELWEKINAKRGFGWDVNPWVWCVEFKKL